jgi:hypothetical protein
MAANPHQLIRDVSVTWDGVTQRIPCGTVIDVPVRPAGFCGLLALQPGSSPLMAAIGSANLVPLIAKQGSSDLGPVTGRAG